MKYYHSIERREIHLPSDLTMEFVPFFISIINEMISISNKDITIYCSSYGGDLYAAFSIIDYITLIEAKVPEQGLGQLKFTLSVSSSTIS